MTKVLLTKTYKARKPGAILDIPEREADSLVALGLGQIIKEEAPASKKKGEKETVE
ncbi:hypothetical protein AB3480_00475 [Rhizobium mongolense]|uniref:hypothetical protein n=1 Tax=Rhizobium mongolense TaxID=57676 RepID=UPI0034A352A7